MRVKLFVFFLLMTFASGYGNSADNPLFKSSTRQKIAPYLLPLDNSLKPVLDAIFLPARVTANASTFEAAGFVTVCAQQSSCVRVAKHPEVPGYLFKVYLDSEVRQKEDQPGWKRLKQRCRSVAKIRALINRKHLNHFVVPDKWIYPLPYYPISPGPIDQPIVLLVTDMNLVDRNQTKFAWKNLATKEILHELYIILSHGYGSSFLTGNIPYTQSGKFALVDTEYPRRAIKMKNVKKYLSSEMAAYWDRLVKSDGKKK